MNRRTAKRIRQRCALRAWGPWDPLRRIRGGPIPAPPEYLAWKRRMVLRYTPWQLFKANVAHYEGCVALSSAGRSDGAIWHWAVLCGRAMDGRSEMQRSADIVRGTEFFVNGTDWPWRGSAHKIGPYPLRRKIDGPRVR